MEGDGISDGEHSVSDGVKGLPLSVIDLGPGVFDKKEKLSQFLWDMTVVVGLSVVWRNIVRSEAPHDSPIQNDIVERAD